MKNIQIGTKSYVFTSWGLVNGTVVKERNDKPDKWPKQYKLDINMGFGTTTLKPWNFWYTEEQLHKYRFAAGIVETVRPVINWFKKLIKK